jgi:regulator of cell morphogenesis and NO signaling
MTMQTPESTDDSPIADAPLPELIEHILTAYHRPLDVALPRIGALAKEVLRIHGERDPKRHKGVLDAFLALANELVPHMQKEEEVLFPMLLDGHSQEALAPIAVMRQEHEMSDNMLRHLRELTDDYTPPADACGKWRELWSALEELERSLRMHVHLEDDILFPRALGETPPVA